MDFRIRRDPGKSLYSLRGVSDIVSHLFWSLFLLKGTVLFFQSLSVHEFLVSSARGRLAYTCLRRLYQLHEYANSPAVFGAPDDDTQSENGRKEDDRAGRSAPLQFTGPGSDPAPRFQPPTDRIASGDRAVHDQPTQWAAAAGRSSASCAPPVRTKFEIS